jgi:hypothetical protein
MPKKTTKETVITETDSKPEEMDSPVQVIAPSMEELDFSEYLESLGPTTNLIKIHKYIDGTRKYCGRVEPSVMKVEGEEYLLRHWGGGKYYLMAFFNGRYVQDGSRLIEVFEIPEEKKVQIAALDSVSQSAFLQAEIQRQHEMVLRLLEGQKAPAPQGPNLTDIVAALGTMKNLVPQPPGLESVLPGLVGLMKFAKEAVSDSSSKESSFGSIVESALKAIPMIFGGLQNMKGNGAPAAVPDQNVLSPEQAEKQLLTQAVQRLKQEAVSGLDPELVVGWISSHQEDVGYRNMAVILLNRQFETLFQVDSDLEKEPLRSWFKKVYDELRKVFIDGDSSQESEPIAG